MNGIQYVSIKKVFILTDQPKVSSVEFIENYIYKYYIKKNDTKHLILFKKNYRFKRLIIVI